MGAGLSELSAQAIAPLRRRASQDQRKRHALGVHPAAVRRPDGAYPGVAQRVRRPQPRRALRPPLSPHFRTQKMGG